MISVELASNADWCLTWAAKGQPMPPEAAAKLAAVLLDLSHQAKQLERLPVDDGDVVFHGGEIEDSL